MELVHVATYQLPDKDVLASTERFKLLIWFPEEVCIVLGRSNKVEDSVFEEVVSMDNIPIYQRPSGGEAVVLTPGMLVVSWVMELERMVSPNSIFRQMNALYIEAFERDGISGVCSDGISDLCIQKKKIMGSSMYLNQKRLFYHAVINLNGDVGLISRYLKHPQREPTYREGRAHESFVTSLAKEGKPYNASFIASELKKMMSETCREIAGYK
ncbi:MAG: lipoate--protein ligase family protein [Tannerellaceae bacterium]